MKDIVSPIVKERLVGSLRKHEIVVFGSFTLRSGMQSSYYCDIKRALGIPSVLRQMVRGLVAAVPERATCIAGSGYGGITLASLVAFAKRLPLVLVRDVVKDHGTKRRIDGYVPTKADRVCIIDDVYTTGSSIAQTKQGLAETGAACTMPVVVLQRGVVKGVIALLVDRDILPQQQE